MSARNAILYNRCSSESLSFPAGSMDDWRERYLEQLKLHGLKVMVMMSGTSRFISEDRYPGGYPHQVPTLPMKTGQSFVDAYSNLYFDDDPRSVFENCVIVWDDEPEVGHGA